MRADVVERGAGRQQDVHLDGGGADRRADEARVALHQLQRARAASARQLLTPEVRDAARPGRTPLLVLGHLREREVGGWERGRGLGEGTQGWERELGEGTRTGRGVGN